VIGRGLIRHWAKAMPKLQPINARAESVPTSGMFRDAFARRRCLVPADGFYEWRKLDAKTQQPMFVHFPDDRTFAFAGLWERWRPQPPAAAAAPKTDVQADQPPGIEDEQRAAPLDTCTIITTTANALMASIHDRMPVILRPEDYARWLDRDMDPNEAAALLRP
jgi:putative SOS response-associated peptidase YedK